MSPMGGRRHKGVGMNRAKKKKMAQPEVVEEESASEEEAEPEDWTPPPQSPPLMPVPELEVEGVAAGAPTAASTMQERLVCARAAARAALRTVKKKERRWDRAKKTYCESGKYSFYDFPSVKKRVEVRLFIADVEFGEAQAQHVARQTRCTRIRAFIAWQKRMVATGSLDPLVERFYYRARARVLEPVPVPSWKSMWPGLSHNIWEWNQKNYGLAVTRGLMDIRHL